MCVRVCVCVCACACVCVKNTRYLDLTFVFKSRHYFSKVLFMVMLYSQLSKCIRGREFFFVSSNAMDRLHLFASTGTAAFMGDNLDADQGCLV